jgi:hypothetical protein
MILLETTDDAVGGFDKVQKFLVYLSWSDPLVNKYAQSFSRTKVESLDFSFLV